MFDLSTLSQLPVIDLSQTISPGMPVYPGTEPPQISYPCTIEGQGFAEKKITLYSHTGTHMDAPAHILTGANTLDRLPPAHFFGTAAVIDLSPLKKPLWDVADFQPFERLIERSEFVLLHSGWSEYWGQARYFEDYPRLSPAAAKWLAGFPLKGFGVDMISIDPSDSRDFPIHRLFLRQNIVVIENLHNLQSLIGQPCLFCCWPLKIEEADGSPIRAVAILMP